MTYIKNLETEKYVLFLTNEFSQWYPSAFVSDEGHTFNCAEQYMMYQKAKLFGDAETAEKILKAETPDEQKKLGRAVKNFDKEIWDAHARDLVYAGNKLKFTQNPHLWQVLQATAGKQLVEAAHYDPVWGIGLRADDPLAADPTHWKGTNWLGETLTRLRDDLKQAGFQPHMTDENRIMFNMRDEDGQRRLYISANELARQFNMSVIEMVSSWTVVPPQDLAGVAIDIRFKGMDETLREGLQSFLQRHAEQMILFQEMEKESAPVRPRKDGYYKNGL